MTELSKFPDCSLNTSIAIFDCGTHVFAGTEVDYDALDASCVMAYGQRAIARAQLNRVPIDRVYTGSQIYDES